MLQSHADRFLGAVRMARTDSIPLAHAEERMFGFDHAHVRGLLAEGWKLAQGVQQAVRHHHDEPDAASRAPNSLIAKVANFYTHLASERRGGWIGDVLTTDELTRFGIERDLHLEILRVTKLTATR